MKTGNYFLQKYPPSESCSCEICLGYCKRPGWWTVEQAEKAMKAGFSNRMMLEISPEMNFAVISPAFTGCEMNFALQQFSSAGCNFLKNNLCELYKSGLIPLECRFCHHDRPGLGINCHSDLEKDWHSKPGRKLIEKWMKTIHFKEAGYYQQLIKSHLS